MTIEVIPLGKDWESFLKYLDSAISRIKKYNYTVVDCSNENGSVVSLALDEVARFHYRIFKSSVYESLKNPKMEWMEKWEIISFKYEFFKDDFRFIDKSHPEFEDCISDCVESLYKEDVIKIHSVRRLDDNKVFTIGNILYDNASGRPFIYGKIDRIWPSFDQMRVDIGRMGANINNKFYYAESE